MCDDGISERWRLGWNHFAARIATSEIVDRVILTCAITSFDRKRYIEVNIDW